MENFYYNAAQKLRSTATDLRQSLDAGVPTITYPVQALLIECGPADELGFPYRPLELKLAGFPLAYRAVAKLAVLRFRGVLKKYTYEEILQEKL